MERCASLEDCGLPEPVAAAAEMLFVSQIGHPCPVRELVQVQVPLKFTSRKIGARSVNTTSQD